MPVLNYTEKFTAGTTVKSDDLDAIVSDMYQRLSVLTEADFNAYSTTPSKTGLILYINGGNDATTRGMSLTNGVFTLGIGSDPSNYKAAVRFKTQTSNGSYNLLDNAVFGYFDSTNNTLTLTAGQTTGYIVATYTVGSAISSKQYSFLVIPTLSFVTTIPDNSVVVATITSGAIDYTKLPNYKYFNTPSRGKKTFSASATPYSFTVPNGVTQLYIDASAGGGSGCNSSGVGSSYVGGGGGGGGASIMGASLTVNAGDTLTITVGRGGSVPTTTNSGGVAGTNGEYTIVLLNGTEVLALGGGGGGILNILPNIGQGGNGGVIRTNLTTTGLAAVGGQGGTMGFGVIPNQTPTDIQGGIGGGSLFGSGDSYVAYVNNLSSGVATLSNLAAIQVGFGGGGTSASTNNLNGIISRGTSGKDGFLLLEW